jgi:hypothetical protein
MRGRRGCAYALSRLVGQVLLDAGAGENEDADRQHIEHLIVALEGCCLGVFGPIGFEGDLGHHLAVVGPAGGDTLGGLSGEPPCSAIETCNQISF